MTFKCRRVSPGSLFTWSCWGTELDHTQDSARLVQITTQNTHQVGADHLHGPTQNVQQHSVLFFMSGIRLKASSATWSEDLAILCGGFCLLLTSNKLLSHWWV